MGYLTESSEVGNIGLKQLREQRVITTNRWDALGLLEGLTGHIKENCAQLFETQLSYMMNESTDSASNGQFETVAFPVIRRVFSKLLANEIVSVQALNLPIGKLFYINPKVSVRVDVAGGTLNGHTSPNGAYSNAATLGAGAGTQFEQRSLYDAYYATEYGNEGSSLFDLSKGRVTTATGTTTFVSPYTDGDKTAYVMVSGFTVTNQGKLVGPMGVPMDTESFLASLAITSNNTLVAPGYSASNITAGSQIPYNVKVQEYGKAIVSKTGQLLLNIDLSFGGTDGFRGFTGGTGTTFSYTYKTYGDLEEDSEMPEVTFGLDEITVSVEPRKMRSQWTPELAQDVSAFHNIDAEAELTALLSETMAAEIDREILRDLRRGCAWTLNWDYNGLRKQTNTYFGTQKDYNQTLVTKINQISAQIQKSTLRGGATWIVVSPEVSAVLNDLEYFHVSNAAPEQDKYNMGIEKIGVLSNRYIVYTDPYAPANTILLGHRGDSILSAGYIFCPYTPIMLTPVMYNPFDFKPIRGICSRYAKKMVLNRYYGKVRVEGLEYFADLLK